MLMCNKDFARLSETLLQTGHTTCHQLHYQARLEMDSPSAAVASTLSSTPSSNDENPRVKLLCSFSGSIMPRPQDGKLRYVGGETRIVSLPRDISYEDLMLRMREIYEGARILKYQQPDEDLDALVSVVNDDDVMNMMEEYDKLGSRDGFTRLRIFLFSHPEQEPSPHFIDADERDPERRYVDALNSLNDVSDFRKQQQTDSSVMNSVDEAHIAEHFYNQINLEGNIHNQRNFEMPIPPFNLRHLTIPCIGSGQHLQSVTQRYNEMEAPWSPAYYSPGHHGHHDGRPLTECPPSPSSSRLRMPLGEIPDKNPEEYSHQQVNHHSQYDHSPQFSENVVWLPPGVISGDKSGFPGNIFHGPNVFEGNSVCEHCRLTIQKNQAYPDFPRKHGEQSQSLMEQSHMGNGAPTPYVGNSCAECSLHREAYVLNTDPNNHNGIYSKDQIESRPLYNDPHNQDRGWILQHHMNPQADEVRAQVTGSGRLMDHYIVDGPGMNFPLSHGNVSDTHNVALNRAHHEDTRYIRVGHELGKEVLHEQVAAAGPVPMSLEECGVRYGNLPYAYGPDKVYKVSHGHLPGHGHALWRNVQNPVHGVPYEASNSVQQANAGVHSGYLKGASESSPRVCAGAENINSWFESSPRVLGPDATTVPECSYGAPLNHNPSNLIQGNEMHIPLNQVQSQPNLINFVSPTEPVKYSNPLMCGGDKLSHSSIPHYNQACKTNGNATQAFKVDEKSIYGEERVTCQPKPFEGLQHLPNLSSPRSDGEADKISKEASLEPLNSDHLRQPEECGEVVKPGESGLLGPVECSDYQLSCLPELLDSLKREVLEGVEEVKARVHEQADTTPLQVSATKEAALEESETVNANKDSGLDSENDNQKALEIEPTKAEEEAIDRGLQTIKNDDLEEIRELGSGTYGAVYHGKWKGSDVAIKRIKASCFAGRPSERERLIADFWKEALILSSLHHPNVVSFYGIVRDGPDGSLATVTEFMVNGSLKQFLKKKDRTIDRRKRLIIAMDTAFGMEYLHGKNIVHFDLKCENLLVNMRDPHRPVCKIGDLGLSKVKQHTLVSGGVRGTLPWMAPELLSGKSNMVSEKIDVYSFGIVMWELLTGEEPYGDRHCASIIGGIVNNTLRPDIPTWCDPEWKSLMSSCWAADPNERPSFSEISQKLRSMAAAINVK